MFVILDGEAQFTDRRTHVDAERAGRRAGADGTFARDLQRDRQAGAVDEHQRAAFHGIYDDFDLGDGRVGAPLDPVPQFISMQLDPSRHAADRELPGRYRDGAVPPRAGTDGLLHDLGIRRSPAAAGRARRSAQARKPASAASIT